MPPPTISPEVLPGEHCLWDLTALWATKALKIGLSARVTHTHTHLIFLGKGVVQLTREQLGGKPRAGKAGLSQGESGRLKGVLAPQVRFLVGG